MPVLDESSRCLQMPKSNLVAISVRRVAESSTLNIFFIRYPHGWLILCCLRVCAKTSLAVKTSTLSLLSSLPCFIFLLSTDSLESYMFMYVSSHWNVSFMGTGALVVLFMLSVLFAPHGGWSIFVERMWPQLILIIGKERGRPDFTGMFPAKHRGKGSGRREGSCMPRKVGGLAEVLSVRSWAKTGMATGRTGRFGAHNPLNRGV